MNDFKFKWSIFLDNFTIIQIRYFNQPNFMYNPENFNPCEDSKQILPDLDAPLGTG